MSNNLKIFGGDLIIGAGRAYERVHGLTKLQQDLELWILERIGTDPATPTFGTTLDGGVINGEIVPSFIGQSATQARVMEIQTEVRRVLELYQETQILKMQNDMAQFGGKHTLEADEILASIDSIETAITSGIVVVKVAITTANSTTLTLTVPTRV